MKVIFKNVNIKFEQNILTIKVDENPIIQNLNLEGLNPKEYVILFLII